jgi:hypothetical protein
MVMRLFLRGWVDYRMVSMIETRTDNIVDEDVMAAVDAAIAARCEKWMKLSKNKLRDRIDAVIAERDPAGVRPPRLDEASRYVDVVSHPSAMGRVVLSGNLNAVDGAALTQRLAALAATVCANDPRTKDQRRADAVGPLSRLEATLACQCGLDDCPAAAQQAAATAAVIHLLAEQGTVEGSSDKPGYLPGFGLVSAAETRALADTAEVKPVAIPQDQAEAGYRPSARVREFLRWRDLTCRWPGCDKPVAGCDVDHTVAWPHGPTHPSNNKHYCRTHHLIKTFCGWLDQQLPDGTIVLTAPSGYRFTTEAHGAALFPTLAQPTGQLDIPPPPDAGVDRTAMMPRRKQSREQDRRDRITAERRERSELIAEEERQRQAWLAANYQPPPF